MVAKLAAPRAARRAGLTVVKLDVLKAASRVENWAAPTATAWKSW